MDKIFQAVMRESVKAVLNSNRSGFSERRDVYIFKGGGGVSKKKEDKLSVIGDAQLCHLQSSANSE